MSDVPRETSKLPGQSAQYPLLSRYASILATRGVERGLIGPRETPRLWPRHLVNCAVVVQDESLITHGCDVADVGSGAGLPGIVWALLRPDLHVTLIEPLLRRSAFLSETVVELGLTERVEVLRLRAEDVRDRDFDVVTARAVSNLGQLIEWTLPLLRPAGVVVALKGQAAAQELAAAAPVLAKHGVTDTEVRQFGAGLPQPTTAVIIRHPGRTR